MKGFGYFTPNEIGNRAHAKDFVDNNWDPIEKRKVIEYLKGCYPTSYAYFEMLSCYICNEHDILSSQDMVDGEWIFPEALIHYVEQHNVVPIKEFLERIRSNNYIVPTLPDEFKMPEL